MTAPDVDAMLTEEGPAAVQAELDRLRAIAADYEQMEEAVRAADAAATAFAEADRFRNAVMAWRARRDETTRVRFDIDMREQGVTIE